MPTTNLWQRVRKRFFHQHGAIRSFDADLDSAGGLKGVSDAGVKIVPTQKVIGSVGRTHNLRSDFFYRSGRAMTDRFVSIGKAMQQGKILPPLELYKVKQLPGSSAAPPPPSEYYVVDGHHRVAMARKLGQDYLDAHVVEYKVAAKAPPAAGADHPAVAGAPSAPNATPEDTTPASGGRPA